MQLKHKVRLPILSKNINARNTLIYKVKMPHSIVFSIKLDFQLTTYCNFLYNFNQNMFLNAFINVKIETFRYFNTIIKIWLK